MKKLVKITAVIMALMFVFASCGGNEVVDENGSTVAATRDPNATEYVPELVTNLSLTSEKETETNKVTDSDKATDVADDEATVSES